MVAKDKKGIYYLAMLWENKISTYFTSCEWTGMRKKQRAGGGLNAVVYCGQTTSAYGTICFVA